jgi:hypothetical protein
MLFELHDPSRARLVIHNWIYDPGHWHRGVEEIVETVQNHPALIVPTATIASPTPAPRRRVRRSIDNDDLIASIDWVTNGLVECLSLIESILDQSTTSDEVPAL